MTSDSRQGDAHQICGISSAQWYISNALSAIKPLRRLVSILAQLVGLALSPVANALSAFVLLLLVLLSLYYFIRSPLQTFASFLLPSSAMTTFLSSLSNLPRLQPKSVRIAYCSSIGIGCKDEPLPIARLARTVSDQALQAHDIFQSVVALGKPESLGLHHTECVMLQRFPSCTVSDSTGS